MRDTHRFCIIEVGEVAASDEKPFSRVVAIGSDMPTAKSLAVHSIMLSAKVSVSCG